MPKFYMKYAGKVNKILESYMVFDGENAQILYDNCPKIFFRNSFWGGGMSPCPSCPTPMSLTHHDSLLTAYSVMTIYS